MNEHLVTKLWIGLVAASISWTSLEAVTVDITCPGQTIQAAVDNGAAGDTISVTGNCNENVLVRNDKQRIFIIGSDGATISGPSATAPTLDVRGKAILIQGFAITGGLRGIHVNRAANAVITNNLIQNTGGQGILIDQLAFAVITGNTIQNNASHGIQVSENSTARIGFNSETDAAAAPNIIQNNSGRGVWVARTSSARVVGNFISGNSNGGDGIQVSRLSQADIASNEINSNAGNGVFVTQNSGVNLGEDNPMAFFDQPNTTTVNNALNGIRCNIGAYVNGHLGNSNQLNGSGGQLNIDASCPGTLATP